jgi:hypothetical protein
VPIATRFLACASATALREPAGRTDWPMGAEIMTPLLHSSFCILPSLPGVHHKHPENKPPLPPASGWPPTALVPPWYHPIPIEPPPNAFFDQASLSMLDHRGEAASMEWHMGTPHTQVSIRCTCTCTGRKSFRSASIRVRPLSCCPPLTCHLKGSTHSLGHFGN